jgi:beta-mannosidase
VHIAALFTNVTPDPIEGNFKLDIALAEQEPPSATLPVTFAAGANRLDMRVTLANPLLWWPASHADLGQPALYTATGTVMLENVLSDTRSTTFGMRTAQVTGEPRHLEVNGRAVFVQATNYIPRQHLADVDVEFYRRDMKLAIAANLNSFGVHGHIQAPSCYKAADQEGMLLFQDFALQWRYDSGTETNPGFVEKACRQIAEMAYTYWNHPSIIYWACHNEPMAMFFPSQEPNPALDIDNQVLDEALEIRLRQVESYRHIHRASGIGDDLHMYDGSLSGGTVYNVRNHRSWFVSEYGFWTLGPRIDKWNDQGWPPDEYQMRQWLSRLSFGPSTMNFTGLPERYTTCRAWQQATEMYGAFLAKYQTEWFRISRGDPFYAYRWHFFVDWWGWAGGGLVDVERKPKATYTALQAASRRILVATSQPNTLFAPGTELQFPIYAINELRATISLHVFWRWSRISSSIVIGADTEVTQRFHILASASENAMIALPHPQHSGDVLVSGSIIGEVGPETTTLLDTLTLQLPDDELAGVTLDLFWGDGETNSFHIVTAKEDWFCGPGAFVISDGKPRRFEGLENGLY